MTQDQLDALYGQVAELVKARLAEGDYSERDSLIALAHAIMADTGWRRADVGTAMRRAYKELGLERRVDSLEMRIRPAGL